MSEQLKMISVVVIAICVIVLLFMEFGGGDSNTVEERLAPPLPEKLRPSLSDPTGGAQELEGLENTSTTTISFENTIVDLGDVKKGEKQKVQFKFSNTGAYPLQVGDIAADFGVTVVSYSQDEVGPGQSGTITVEFDSGGLEAGQQDKIVHVNANAEPKHIHLQVSGNVVP